MKKDSNKRFLSSKITKQYPSNEKAYKGSYMKTLRKMYIITDEKLEDN
jgi:hypothetical protein